MPSLTSEPAAAAATKSLLGGVERVRGPGNIGGLARLGCTRTFDRGRARRNGHFQVDRQAKGARISFGYCAEPGDRLVEVDVGQRLVGQLLRLPIAVRMSPSTENWCMSRTWRKSVCGVAEVVRVSLADPCSMAAESCTCQRSRAQLGL